MKKIFLSLLLFVPLAVLAPLLLTNSCEPIDEKFHTCMEFGNYDSLEINRLEALKAIEEALCATKYLKDTTRVSYRHLIDSIQLVWISEESFTEQDKILPIWEELNYDAQLVYFHPATWADYIWCYQHFLHKRIRSASVLEVFDKMLADGYAGMEYENIEKFLDACSDEDFEDFRLRVIPLLFVANVIYSPSQSCGE